MFNFFGKKKGDGKLYAPITGTLIPLDQVEDPVFSQKMLGDGIATEPKEGKVYAPCNGSISTVMDTKHAIGLTSEDGLDILIHVGMDTVGLNGEGFTPHVNEGDSVKKGDLLMEFDIDFIKSKGLKTVTPMIITNMDSVKSIRPAEGEVKAKEGVALEYTKA